MASPAESFPLSPAQQEIWLGQLRFPSSAIFTIGECVELRGRTELDALQRAIREVVAETETLRMKVDPARPVFSLPARLEFPIPVLDLRDAADAFDRACDWMLAEMRKPFAFDGSPLVRFALLALGDEQTFLFHAYHHVAIDGLGVLLVTDRLAERYTAIIEARPAGPCTFTPYAGKRALDAAYPESDAFRQDRDYWAQRLSPPPPLASFALSPRAPAGFRPGIRSSLTLPRAAATALCEGASLTQVMLAATALHLQRLTGCDDAVIGLTVGGRVSRAMRDLPGMFSNIAAVRLALRPDATFELLCDEAGQQIRNALRRQRYRIEDVERNLALADRAPLRRTSVNVISDKRVVRFGAAQVIFHDLSNDPTEDLVAWSFDFYADGPLPVDFIGHPDLYTPEELQGHHASFLALLERLAEDGVRQRPLRSLESDTPGSRRRKHRPGDEPAWLGSLGAEIRSRRNPALCDSRPLSHEQDAQWRQRRAAGFRPVECVLRCDGPVDLNRLESALQTLVERHAVLRTSVVESDGEPRQRIEARGRVALQFETASDPASMGDPAPLALPPAGGPWLRTRVVRGEGAGGVLIVTLHPLIADVRSAGTILTELSRLCSTVEAQLPPVGEAFGDYATRQAVDRGSAASRANLAYWRTTLAGAERLALRHEPAPGGARKVSTQTLPAALSRGVAERARTGKVSEREVLLAAFAALLARYTGKRDFVIGVAVPAPDAPEQTVGCFEQVLPLRFDFAGDPGFGELLTRVLHAARAASAHREVSFGDLTLLQPPAAGDEPYFGVAFHFSRARSRALPFGAARAEIERFPGSATPAELTLNVVAVAGEIILSCDYDSARLGASTVARLLTHFVSHLETCLANPDRPLHTLPVGDSAEQRKLLVEWNPTIAAAPERLTFTGLFQRQVAATPDAVALEDRDRAWTYRELDRHAARLARSLRQKGAGPERIVGVLFDHSLEAVAAIVGVLQSGAAYLPLDPANPRARLDYMLADAGVKLVVTRESFAASVDPTACELLFWENAAEATAAPADDKGEGLQPDHLAYVIYTSGTTGNPKGVMVSHANWTQEIRWVAANFGYRPGARVLQFSSLGFDVSAEEIGATLTSGATLVCASRLEMFPGATLTGLLAQRAITHLTLSPSALAACPLVELPALEKIILGGEACPRELAERWGRGARLVNGYGPTETTIIATCDNPLRLDPGVSIGRPIDHYRLYVLDARGQPAPFGVPGELFIGGAGVTRGYLGRPALTAEKFVPDPFGGEPGARLYRTGDLVRYLDGGRLEFCGRLDEQVKIRGFRIELGEVASVLRQHLRVPEAVVAVRDDQPGGPQLVAYIVGEFTSEDLAAIRAHAAAALPSHMVPARLVPVAAIPLTPNGKADLKALGQFRPPALPTTERAADRAGRVIPNAPLDAEPGAQIRRVKDNPPYRSDSPQMETAVAALWSEVLGVASPGVTTNFFELGGNSLLLVKVQEAIGRVLGRDVPILDLFKHPTIRALAEHLDPRAQDSRPITTNEPAPVRAGDRAEQNGIAIIGMAGRFPGARDIDEFWRNLRDGRDGITRFDDDALLRAGVSATLLGDPQYVKAMGALERVEYFDAPFFGFSPREAALMDPQHRLFLETAWHALEHAGCDPSRHAGAIGVYAGAGMNTYRANLGALQALTSGDAYMISLGNDKDFIPTRTSYKLNLRGPSLNVNTACSSSLVAVHLARQALLAGECDMALAGGVSVLATQTAGYLFRENGIFSPDGRCRAFARDARGTVPASGVGIVVLKRLADAIRDRDTIYAVVEGSAINNDGAVKVGYTAPSVEGQAEVIRRALRSAQVSAEAIGYVEAHGTATELGDPIEIEALTKAFAADTQRTQFCAIGSVKSNLGHVDAAAGVASLMKCALSLTHGELPASLHCAEPNPAIDFAHSPFYVNNAARAWPRTETPRFCGVSSFGIGGTNAHVVLREPPPGPATQRQPRSHHLLVLSARTPAALDEQAANLRRHLEADPAVDLIDAAFTLAQGRRAFPHRRIIVGRDHADLGARFGQQPASGEAGENAAALGRPVAFLFPGQGSQYAGMAAGVYRENAVFHDIVDHCCERLRPHLDRDLRELLFAAPGSAAAGLIHETQYAQPALFVVQYALARVWLDWGVQPAALIGHSVGEITAACVAGVFQPDDALAFVARRGRLIQDQPPGAMLAVPLAPEALADLLGDGLALATHNAADRCVVAGDFASVAALERRLGERGVRALRLHTSHAFHSAMMEPAVEPLVTLAATFALAGPKIPMIGNVAGGWLTREQAVDPRYWGAHLRRPVRFHDGLTQLLRDGTAPRLLLEVGPGRTLKSLADRHPDRAKAAGVVASLPGETDREPDVAHLLGAVGRVWLGGGAIDWEAFYRGDAPRRVPLPGYAFQRERHWIEPVPSAVLRPPATDPVPSVAHATTTLPLPEHETATVILGFWRELLGVSRAGLHDSFFELGGDSLLGLQLLSRLRERFGVQLSLRALFDAPTAEALALAVEEAILSEIERAATAPQEA